MADDAGERRGTADAESFQQWKRLWANLRRTTRTCN